MEVTMSNNSREWRQLTSRDVSALRAATPLELLECHRQVQYGSQGSQPSFTC